MQYNDDDFRQYPFYIERDCKTNRASYTIKLSKPIRDELDDLFVQMYGRGQKQQGLHNMVLEYLNTKCLKQGYFNFEYYLFTSKNTDIEIDNILLGGCLDLNAVLQDYANDVDYQDDLFIKNQKKFRFDKLKELTLPNLCENDLIFKNFNVNGLNSQATYDDFLQRLDDWKTKKDAKELYEIKIYLNNFLDFKVKGQYRSNMEYKMPIHHGIGQFADANHETYYYHYKWVFNSHDGLLNDVQILEFHLIDYDEFFELIANCDNRFLRTFAGISDLVDEFADIDKEIDHIKNKIETWQSHLQTLEKMKKDYETGQYDDIDFMQHHQQNAP